MDKWYAYSGDCNDVVISTRIRLARNIEGYPFPVRLGTDGMKKVSGLIKDAVESKRPGDFRCIDMGNLSRAQTISLAERHLISPDFTQNKPGSALLFTPDEGISIMLCEEDHIRLQVMKPGLALEDAYRIADEIDDVINSSLNYSFDEKLGYLTHNPTDLGTAMKASVILHLPALTACGRISKLASTVSKLGLSIRSAYGDGSGCDGNLYQLSNRVTLGITEENAIANLKSITVQLVSQERAAADELVKSDDEQDRIFRSLGILLNARLLTCDEFMTLISSVRMGIFKGLIRIDPLAVENLIINMQPATIMATHGEAKDARDRDRIRAAEVREALAAAFLPDEEEQEE